jgi:hypothetical protein
MKYNSKNKEKNEILTQMNKENRWKNEIKAKER